MSLCDKLRDTALNRFSVRLIPRPLVRVEVAERAQVALTDELRATAAAATQARSEAERFQQMPGLRGKVVRWLTR